MNRLKRELDYDTVFILREILRASIRIASAETCYEPEAQDWTSSKPLHGHCGAVAYIVRVVLGGEIVSGIDSNNDRWLWNRLPNGVEVALTYFDPFNPPKGKRLPIRKYVNKRYQLFLERMQEQFRD